MKIHFSFVLLRLTRKNVRKVLFGVLLTILLRKTRQRRDVTYDVIDELRRFSLSNCYPALCHNYNSNSLRL